MVLELSLTHPTRLGKGLFFSSVTANVIRFCTHRSDTNQGPYFAIYLFFISGIQGQES